MTFTIITVFCLLALFIWLSFYSFRLSPEDRYFPWLRGRISKALKEPWIERAGGIYRLRFIQRYPADQRWIYLGLAASCAYLVLSGMIFALIHVRLFGLFLLIHVVLGGLFAVCLCLAVMLRARFYVWNRDDFAPENLKTEAGKRKAWQVILFWIFVTSGLVLVVTALFQMLPQFSLRHQIFVFEVHRYAALGILVAGIAFMNFSEVDDGR